METSQFRILQPLILFEAAAWQTLNFLPEKIPTHRIPLGRFPTPIHPFKVPGLEDFDIWIKRDDLTSCDMSGNKVRKLEFLMAECLLGDYDSVITIGGLQSNHARATAVASKQLGLQPHLVLRTTAAVEDIDITGNLLWNRMVGSKIYTVSPGTYARIGSNTLVERLSDQLKSTGAKPYGIPVGGSNALGAFGYMETIKEIVSTGVHYDHIIVGCGSGGTVAGLAIALRLTGHSTKLHAVGVCDNPKYFYDHIREVAIELGINFDFYGQPEDWCNIYNGQGIGYAKSTSEELKFLAGVASVTGVVLDPVYSGKALYHFANHLVNAEIKAGEKVLFIHTGGTYGLYDKASQLLEILPQNDVQKMTIDSP